MGQNGNRNGVVRRSVRVGVGLALLLCVLALSGCTMAGFGPQKVSPEERAAYDSALGNLPANPDATREALSRFLELYPSSPLADDALEQLAELAFSEGADEEGMRWLGRILSDYPDSDRAPSARLRLAQQEYARDKKDSARRVLQPLRLRDLSRTEQRAALRLRVALSVTPVERMLHLAHLRSLLESERKERADDPSAVRRLTDRLEVVDEDIRSLIGGAAPAELEAMLEELRGRPPAAAVALESSRRALDAGQFGLADDRLRRAERLVRTDLEQGELRLLQGRLSMLEETAAADAELPPLRELVDRPRPATAGAQGTIGVVLPLTGDFGAFGQESLRGLLLAADLFESREADGVGTGAYIDAGGRGTTEREARTQMRVLVRDSAGDPQRAAAAVRELADEPGLVAIVGPIFSSESFAAAEAAEAAGVPIVTLSHREEVPVGRAQVFRTRTTPGDEVDVLVQHAFEVLGAERFGVLYPRNRYGRGMRKLYWDAVMARGGKMVAASSYEPDATDFSGPIRDMIGYRFLTALEREALAEREDAIDAARRLEPEEARELRKAAYEALGPEEVPLPPIVDFDVLFIPDSADKIGLIAPGLAFHEVRGVNLLGSSEWLDPDLLRTAYRHLKGSVVSTAFYAESDVPFVAEFVSAYRATFGEPPDTYAAQAFDAANLVLVQIAAGHSDRNGIREGLLETRAYPGATGVPHDASRRQCPSATLPARRQGAAIPIARLSPASAHRRSIVSVGMVASLRVLPRPHLPRNRRDAHARCA